MLSKKTRVSRKIKKNISRGFRLLITVFVLSCAVGIARELIHGIRHL